MNRDAFFSTMRSRMGMLTTGQVSGTSICLDAAIGAPLSHQAYMLATAWHETNRTMQPVREAYWLSEAWRKEHLRYYPWYGRGYVQLTWEPNYARADKECAESGLTQLGAILADANIAMRPVVAAFIMRRGMDEGWFTGVKLSAVLPMKGVATREQYMNARTIINGRDKADLVEDYAQIFERALRDSGVA